MAAPHWWRRLRQHFGISAPRMAVQTRLPWWGRTVVLLGLLGVVGGMWWWGFDFGQFFGGFNRREVETRLTALEAEAARLRTEAAEVRARNSQLDSDLAMTKGAQDALTRQVTDLTGENTQLKEELAFLQKIFADTNRTTGVTLPRLTVERQSDDVWRYSVLVVHGGNPGDDFEGRVTLQATLVPVGGGPPSVLNLPEDQPGTESALKLKFKYYQRLEGRLRVPAGARLTALTARVYEGNGSSPRVTRTLSNP